MCRRYETERSQNFEANTEETGAQAMAQLNEPPIHHNVTAFSFAAKVLGVLIEPPGLQERIDQIERRSRRQRWET